MKTVLITGASRGIGRASALAFARAGYAVAAGYHTGASEAAQLLSQLRELGADAETFQADVADRIQVEAAVSRMTARFGHIDVLVNNAGIAAPQKLLGDFSPQEWERLLAVNVTGLFYTCRAVLPQMIARKSGRIINLSSIWGICGGSCEVPYSTAKAAAIGFTKALAKEVGPSGITVNCVAPGVIDTQMNAALPPQALEALAEETPLGRLGTPEEVAACILFLAGEQGAFLTGQVLSPNGGLVI